MKSWKLPLGDLPTSLRVKSVYPYSHIQRCVKYLFIYTLDNVDKSRASIFESNDSF